MKKSISRKRHSLYLDFYSPVENAETGKFSRREVLGMYIFDNTRNPLGKIHNTNALQLADIVKN